LVLQGVQRATVLKRKSTFNAKKARAGATVRPTDKNPALISLYRGIATGWRPPEAVTEAEYHAARSLPVTDPMHGFAAFCCSFGGKMWGGYARGEGRNFAAERRRAILRDCPGFQFRCIDFLAIEPCPLGVTIYCDPPYRGTTGYRTGAFASELFDHRVRGWARAGNDVFVSEYACPAGVEIASWPCLKRAGGGGRGLGYRTAV
jgi:DNA adenine methylase